MIYITGRPLTVRKLSIMLEETETPYNLILVNIMTGDKFQPEFIKVSPNDNMSVIVDRKIVVSRLLF